VPSPQAIGIPIYEIRTWHKGGDVTITSTFENRDIFECSHTSASEGSHPRSNTPSGRIPVTFGEDSNGDDTQLQVFHLGIGVLNYSGIHS